MAETKEDKKEIIKKEKVSDKLVIDEENKAFDIYDILEQNKDAAAVIKLNRLLQYGVTVEMIADKYSKYSTDIVDINSALDSLKKVFNELANDISKAPNGIVIDLNTGLKDPNKSQEQAVEVGILDESGRVNLINSIYENQQNIGDKNIILFDFSENNEKRCELAYDFFYKNNLFNDAAIDNVFKEDTDKPLNVSLETERRYKESQKKLEKYDLEEMQLIQLQINLEKSKGTNRYDETLQKRNEYLKKHPRLKKDLPNIMDNNTRKVSKDSIDKLSEFKSDVSKIYAAKMISYINNKGIDNLTKIERKEAIIAMLGAYKGGGMTSEIGDTLKTLCPGLDYSKGDEEYNFEIIQKALEYTEKININEFNNIMDACQDRILKKVDFNKIIKNEKTWGKPVTSGIKKMAQIAKGKVLDKVFTPFFEANQEELNVNEIVLNYKESKEQKYFRNSNMNFSKSDGKTINSTYRRTSIESWIDDKGKALEYRYIYLNETKKELENSDKTNKLISSRLQKINDDLKNFKKNNSKLDYEKMENPSKDTLYRVKNFEDLKIKARLSKEFIKDEEKVNTFEDYNKLSKEDKKNYLRNTIVALNLEKVKTNGTAQEENKLMAKFGKRRLEIINNSDKEFVKITKNPEEYPIPYVAEVNENAILEEYNSLSSHKFNSYEELSYYCELNKKQYINDKLEKYEKLKESDFIKLKDGKLEEKIQEIEMIKDHYKIKNNTQKNLGDKENKKSQILNEDIKFEEENNVGEESNVHKNSLINRVRNTVSNFIKTSNQNHEQDILNQENLPIEQKNDIFSKISRKLKSVFANENKDKQTMKTPKNVLQENSTNQNAFDTTYHVDVNINEAVKNTNSENNKNEKTEEQDIEI